ncbi:SIMPL domain-containing protein [Simiduia agarivorans]|uniref:DUF541 domain-containing protein n=1 Tax=Simiduia agarivorans (strain DSM 21679 / JCM 13881 / BCRC 17597 / SA1) TaxID=1117647 RepID=K4L015_SIMAS|nr:SIMPL domain-containing protein [Simiduia agarivorans]AFU99517.1 hypothetical protein M5M_11700 [Simiduia agarivorans SA1 = DSM 21679]
MHRIFLVLFLALISQAAVAANLPDFPFIVSVGKAEREVKPDIATVNLGIVSFESSSELAIEKVGLATDGVLKVLQSYGISASAVEATDMEKSTKRRRDSEYNNLAILGYEVSRALIIELNDLSKYSELVSDIVAIDNVTGVRTAFDVTDRIEIERELVGIASKDARNKAEQMAEGLGTKIRSVYAISQNSDFGSFFATFGARSDQILADLASPTGRARVVMFVPKTITISQGINVVFRMK